MHRNRTDRSKAARHLVQVGAALAVLGLAACISPQPPRVNPSTSDAGPKVYRTLDGQTFATAEARSAYLKAADAARARGNLKRELARIRIKSGSLSAQQAGRRTARIRGQDRRITRATAQTRAAAQELARTERLQRRLRREDGPGQLIPDAEAQRARITARQNLRDLQFAEARARRAERERIRLERIERRSRRAGRPRSVIVQGLPELP